ncbi:RHS repeat-associated protein [Nocardioides luteus]|uniref:Uncharacterized protein n=1 Tax=Nocardioides luteus TaxID=1844 RepID=A0ABQ5STI9_9ACTN|nr:RHS repeat-associated core domain-containing protein [Nocardioides luteus]MDR7309028.1 RHS repeat-associated protein [Nocardioides luteus]GGR50276.1 hypothetical protein GCM10010197_15420 [Nocardioides luteus]GLJ67435.1 hypothetical protein GCM10017579_14710 [Nocardioides luteus]
MGLYSKALSATEIAAIHDVARTAEGAAARRSVAQSMCWDREGRLVKTLTAGETCADGVVDELGEAEYVYSGSGERIIRADAEAVTIYLPGGQEVTIPRDETRNVSAHRYYAFNGETIAVRDQRGLGGVTSLVNDHHGTSIVSISNTTWTPASIAKHYTDPFGAARGAEVAATVGDRDANGSPGDRGFLGKPSDTTGLTQVGARYYDVDTGTFVSPDPLLDPTEPRHFSAYAYSLQDPINYSDASGLGPIGIDGEPCPSCDSRVTQPPASTDNDDDSDDSESSGDSIVDAVDEQMEDEFGYTPEEIQFFKEWVFDYSGCDASPEKCASGFDPFKKFGKFKLRWPLGKKRKNNNSAPEYHVGDVLGDTSKLKGWIPKSIPKNAQYAIDDIAKSGVDASQGRAGTHGFAGPLVPEIFGNDGRNGAYVLPRTTPGGDAITYQERGVWQSLDNPEPGGERIVTGSDGSIYYSATHYQTYIVGATGR